MHHHAGMFICLLLIHSLGGGVNIWVQMCKYVLCEFVSEVSLRYRSLSEIGSLPGRWISELTSMAGQ